MEKKRQALGKGLGALLPTPSDDGFPSSKKGYTVSPIEDISPNKYQPRKTFNSAKLIDLVKSIEEKGVIQPLLVRRKEDGKYELIAGERRWRAAQKAGLKEVPVVIKEVSDSESLELAIIENIQRDDLNPVEEAEGYQRLIDEFSYTHEVMATRVGKDRATISNHLRILKLPDDVKKDMVAGTLTMGHAKALLSLGSKKDILDARALIAHKGMSVREAEALVKKIPLSSTKNAKPTGDPNLRGLEEKLTKHFGTKVRIVKKGRSGKVEINFYSPDELERLIETLVD